jgi:hypothetical protein
MSKRQEKLLLGVAGKQKSKSENGESAGKKRTPGEIRI